MLIFSKIGFNYENIIGNFRKSMMVKCQCVNKLQKLYICTYQYEASIDGTQIAFLTSNFYEGEVFFFK